MRGCFALTLFLAACAHDAGRGSTLVQASVPLATTGADASFEAAMAELAAARFQSAGRLFKDFADRYPADSRVFAARLHQAYAALNQLDQVRGLDEAQEILTQLPQAPTDAVAVQQLEALILARAQALQAQAAVSELLTRCEGQAGSAVDRERAQMRSQVGKLQQELQRREETLEQVKQRLLEIQRMASDTLGAPISGEAERDAGAPQ
jgi:outer membrane protein assembly factor BamD (BamD/ComL family)